MRFSLLFILISSAFFACKSPRSSSLKLIGGEDAEAPSWYASIVKTTGGRNTILCGATLIDTKTVLTAAHCVSDLGSPISVVMGISDKTNISEESKIAVKAIHIHENYSKESNLNDIALVYLESAPSANPINLEKSDPSGSFETFGFGKSSNFGKLSFDKLQKLELKRVENSKCSSAFSRLSSHDAASYYCFTGPSVDRSSCDGDSGSAVVYKKADKDYIAAVSSFGKQVCGLEEGATVYMSLAHYFSWIEEYQTYEKFEKKISENWADYYKKIRGLCYYGKSYNDSAQTADSYWYKNYDINLPTVWEADTSNQNFTPETHWALCDAAKNAGMDVVYGNLGSEKGFKVDAQALGDSSKYLKAEIAETTAISCKVGDEPLEVEVDKDFENGSLSFLGQVHKMEKTESACSGQRRICDVSGKL